MTPTLTKGYEDSVWWSDDVLTHRFLVKNDDTVSHALDTLPLLWLLTIPSAGCPILDFGTVKNKPNDD